MWKDVIGYEGIYRVSDEGEVLSLNYRRTGIGKILQPITNKRGYQKVSLYKNGKMSVISVHLIVLEAFIGPRPINTQGCHKDGNKLNNRLINLRWDDQRGNFFDDNSLEKHYNSKLTNQDRLDILEKLQYQRISQKELAKSYSVSIMTISNIATNRNHIMDRVKRKINEAP